MLVMTDDMQVAFELRQLRWRCQVVNLVTNRQCSEFPRSEGIHSRCPALASLASQQHPRDISCLSSACGIILQGLFSLESSMSNRAVLTMVPELPIASSAAAFDICLAIMIS